MATLFWFLLGTGLCIAISRYNEDDALFWKLFIAFTGSFAAATAYKATVENENKEKVVIVNEAPTQVLQSMPCNFYTLADISLAATEREKSPKPVSKDTLLNNNDSLLSKVQVLARGQPFWIGYFDTS